MAILKLSPLAEIVKQAHLVIPTTFTYQDGVLNRVLSLKQSGSQSFLYTALLIVGIILKNAGQLWYDALTNILTSR